MSQDYVNVINKFNSQNQINDELNLEFLLKNIEENVSLFKTLFLNNNYLLNEKEEQNEKHLRLLSNNLNQLTPIITKYKFKHIKLNARGVKYEVLCRNLDKYPNTRLGKLKCATRKDELLSLCDDFDSELNEYYFDRDPIALNMILNFYSTGKLHLSSEICVLNLKDELIYWQIDENFIDLCCKIVYYEATKEISKHMANEQLIFDKLNEKNSFGEYFFPELREKIWCFLEKPHSSYYAMGFLIFSVFMITLSTAELVLRTLPNFQNDDLKINLTQQNITQNITSSNSIDQTDYKLIFDTIELVCVCWFAFELILGVICCPDKLDFIKNPLNIIDFLSIFPYFLWLALSQYPAATDLKNILRMFRIVLYLRAARHSFSLKSLAFIIKNSYKEFFILFIYLSIGLLFFSSFVYYCEKDVPYTQYTSIPAAFWWTIITMTTVGYGDIVPTTLYGKMIGGMCAVCGIIILAMPIGVITSKYSDFEKQKEIHERLMKQQKKMNLEKDKEKTI